MRTQQVKRVLYCPAMIAMVLAIGTPLSAAPGGFDVGSAVVAKSGAKAARIHAILERWTPVAQQLGHDAALWHDTVAIQLSQASEATLAKLAEIDPRVLVKGTRKDGAELYRTFMATLAGDLAERHAPKERMAKALGSTNQDLVFTPVFSPCRLVDTRNVGGAIGPGATRHFFGFTDGTTPASFSATQGGISGTASAVCSGGAFFNPAAGSPSTGTPSDPNVAVAAMLTITVVNQGGAGNFIAWTGVGGQPLASALNYEAFGKVGAVANTTVVPFNVGRGTTGRDFAISVNSLSSADVVVDVVGYFSPPFATALTCYTTSANTTVCPAINGSCSAAPPACFALAGYTPMGINCSVSDLGMRNAGFSADTCYWQNNAFSAQTGYASRVCCRINGR